MFRRHKGQHHEKLVRGFLGNRDFCFSFFRDEWDRLQKETLKEELVKKGREAALVTGQFLLKFLAVVGICGVALAAPKVFVAYDYFSKRRKVFLNQQGFRKQLYYFKRQGYVKTEKIDEGFRIHLTKKGERRAFVNFFETLKKREQKKWDGVWRVVIFDIPEKHKWAREGLRQKLKDFGFYQLQQSVFVSPDECREELDFIISVLGVGDYVHTMKTSEISAAESLKIIFNLS